MIIPFLWYRLKQPTLWLYMIIDSLMTYDIHWYPHFGWWNLAIFSTKIPSNQSFTEGSTQTSRQVNCVCTVWLTNSDVADKSAWISWHGCDMGLGHGTYGFGDTPRKFDFAQKADEYTDQLDFFLSFWKGSYSMLINVWRCMNMLYKWSSWEKLLGLPAINIQSEVFKKKTTRIFDMPSTAPSRPNLIATSHIMSTLDS